MEQDKLSKILYYLPKFMNRESTSNNSNFIKSFADEFEVFSQNSTLLKQAIQISTATSTYLDDLGELFSVRRTSGESDDTYKSRILSYWSSLIGGGIDESIKKSVAGALGIESSLITITDIDANIFSVGIPVNETTTTETINILRSLVSESKAAGTYLKELDFQSEGGIFRTNISYANGNDTLL